MFRLTPSVNQSETDFSSFVSVFRVGVVRPVDEYQHMNSTYILVYRSTNSRSDRCDTNSHCARVCPGAGPSAMFAAVLLAAQKDHTMDTSRSPHRHFISKYTLFIRILTQEI